MERYWLLQVVVDLNNKIKKILGILFLILIVALSVTVFVMRDKIGEVSDIGYLGLFFLCFLANATVFLPAPSLMLAASCALIMNPWLVALFAALGSSLGELVGYVFGAVSIDVSPKFQKLMGLLAEKIHNRTVLVFVLALLPLPLFDVAGVYSGGTKMNLVKFFIVCFGGKFIKMLVYTRMYDILQWAVLKI